MSLSTSPPSQIFLNCCLFWKKKKQIYVHSSLSTVSHTAVPCKSEAGMARLLFLWTRGSAMEKKNFRYCLRSSPNEVLAALSSSSWLWWDQDFIPSHNSKYLVIFLGKRNRFLNRFFKEFINLDNSLEKHPVLPAEGLAVPQQCFCSHPFCKRVGLFCPKNITGQDATSHCKQCALFTQFYSWVKQGTGLLYELSTVTQPIDLQAAPSPLAERTICWLVKFISVGLEKSARTCFVCCAVSRGWCPPSRWRSGSAGLRRWSLCTLPLLNSAGRRPTKRAKYL